MAADISYSTWDTLDSPYASVLHTNYVPSITELGRIKDFMLQPQTELSRLECEISHLQTLLSESISQRDRVKGYIDAHNALVSPIRQLPAETIAEIFVNCLPTERPPVRSLAEAPLLLTSVCRTWRTIAIETPRLWNSLHIFLPRQISPQVLARREAGTAMWLKRSGSLALLISVTIDESDFYPPALVEAEPVVPDSFFRSLLHFSHRFEQLSLALGSEKFASLEALSPDSFPALKTFSIDATNRNRAHLDGANNLFFAPFINRLPALRRLKVRSFGGSSGSEYAALPCNWQNLTELSLLPGSRIRQTERLTTDVFLSILAQTPRLESCHALVSLRTNSVVQTQSVHLPSLHTMWLGTVDERSVNTQGAHISHVLHAISSPLIKTLIISWRGHGFPAEGFTSAPFPLMTSLERLRLEAPMTSSTLTECLTLVPNLTVLEVLDLGYQSSAGPQPLLNPENFHHTVHTSNLVQLTSDGNDGFPSMCPQLKVFKLVVRNHMHSFTASGDAWNSSGALLRFLESRRPHSQLQCCDVLLSSDPKSFAKEVLEGLRRLERGGLNLRIRCYNPFPMSRDSPTLGIGAGSLSHSSPELLPPLVGLETTAHGSDPSMISTVVNYGTTSSLLH